MPRIDHRAPRPGWVHAGSPAPAAPSSPCPGRCNDPWRRAEELRLAENVEHTLTAAGGDPVWCTACRNRLYYGITGLPYLAALLQIEVDHGTNAETERVSGTSSRPLHTRESVTMLIDAIWSALAEREDQVRRERRLSARLADGVRRGVQLQASALFLPRHVDWFLQDRPDDDRVDPETGEHAHSSARAFCDQIAFLERRALRATKSNERRPELRPDVPCPECDLKALEYDLDVETQLATGDTRCRNCRRMFSPQRMEEWLGLLAAKGRKQPEALRAFYASRGAA